MNFSSIKNGLDEVCAMETAIQPGQEYKVFLWKRPKETYLGKTPLGRDWIEYFLFKY